MTETSNGAPTSEVRDDPQTSGDRDSLDPSVRGSSLDALRERYHLTRIDVVVASVAGLSLVAWAPVFVSSTLPRNALAIGFLPVGIGILVSTGRRGDRAAAAAIVCCVVFIASGLLAEAPRASFVGQQPEWASVVALIASLGWWAVGRGLSPGGRLLLAGSLAAGAVLNGAIAVAQLLMDAQPNELFRERGRGSGLMSNPVFYGSVMAGIAAVWTGLACERVSRFRLGLCALLAFVAGISGGRIVFISTVVYLAVVFVVWRRKAMLPVAFGFGGVVAADLFLRLVANLGSSSGSSVDRLVNGESGCGRLDIWRFGLAAFSDRPLLGWGPANVELAVTRRIDLQFAQRYWSDGEPGIWWDPHNVVVWFLVSVGVVGVGAVITFLALALRGRISWPYLVGAVTIAITWMAEPFTVHSLPIALLLLGAAVWSSHGGVATLSGSGDDALAQVGRPPDDSMQRWQRVTLALGGLVTVVMLSAAFAIDRWSEDGNPERAGRVAAVFGGDAWLEMYLANASQRAFMAGDSDPSLLQDALEHAERAASIYPTSEHFQRVADAQYELGDLEGAQMALERAIELQSTDPFAWARLYAVANLRGDDELAAMAGEQLCLFGEYWCGYTDQSEGLATADSGR